MLAHGPGEAQSLRGVIGRHGIGIDEIANPGSIRTVALSADLDSSRNMGTATGSLGRARDT